MRAEKMRPAVIVGVLIAIAVIVLIMETTPTREAIPGIGSITTGLADAFLKAMKAGNVPASQAKTWSNAFKEAESLGDTAKMNDLIAQAKAAAKTDPAVPDQLSSLQKTMADIGGGVGASQGAATASKVARGTQIIKSLFASQKTQKQLKSRAKAILEGTGAFTDYKTLANAASASVAQKRGWQNALDSLGDSELSIMYGYVKNPALKEITQNTFSARVLNLDTASPVNAVNQTPRQTAQAAGQAQNEVARVADAPPADPVIIARTNATVEALSEPSVLQALKKYEKWGLIVGGLGIVSGVVASVVSILVKPPYWNDSAVLDGTGGAKPGTEQSAVNFINWVNENPAAVTSSSCMSCICCCCCCLLLIMAMSGGKKSGNNTNF